jgi:hypothetical protein
MSEEIVCVLCVAGMPHPELPECTSDDKVEKQIKQAASEAVIGRPPKSGDEFTDAESTGRKRAAELLPTEVLNTMICEWALLQEAGGGKNPITGCHGNRATDRHHGPDKNTLNNERRQNLHAICSYCHNLWHAKNDSTYEGERPKGDTPWLPMGEFKEHDPDGPKITVQQALLNELTRYK